MLILITIVVALLVYWKWTSRSKERQRFEQLANKLAGPQRLPVIGSALEYGTNSQEFLNNLMRISEQYGDVNANWLGKTLYVVTYTAENTEIILSSKNIINKAEIYKYLKPWLGTGLVSADAEKWRKHRKLLTPAFHFKILEQYVETFENNLKLLVKNLESELNKEQFDVVLHIDQCTLDIISETAMATEIRSEKNGGAFRSALKKASYAVLYRSFKPWLHHDVAFKWSPTGAIFHKSVETIQDFIQMLISKRKKEKMENGHVNHGNNEDIFFGYKRRIAFIDLLLEFATDSKTNLTDQEILDEVNTFMFAGHDTTTSSISFTLYILSRHPEIQEKVVEEIIEIFGDLSDKPFTYNDLLNMKYLERVIKETLRLYPSVPYIGRMLDEEITLQNDITLPIGCSVILLFHKLHRDPKTFPNPEEFNPDNFLPERLIGRHPFAYCPFSAGPRNCIGQKFAMLEMKATILCILRNYCILPGKTDIKLASELIIRSSTGVNISIRKRCK